MASIGMTPSEFRKRHQCAEN